MLFRSEVGKRIKVITEQMPCKGEVLASVGKIVEIGGLCCNANRPKENMQCAERIACDIFSGRPFISYQKVKMIVENPE